MRREQTAPEQKLWLELRAKRFAGGKFRRQVVIDRYIVDFACRNPTKLVVEVDGDTHAGRERYDAARTAELEKRGYGVMRFTNSEVTANLDGVLTTIRGAFDGLPLSPALSPEGERG
jgi:very-short-patch-repair endonuclease